MDLTGLLDIIKEKPEFRKLVGGLIKGNVNSTVPEAVKPYLISVLFTHLKRPLLVITSQPEKAKNLYEQVYTWVNSDRVLYFPEPDGLPYQRVVSDSNTEAKRLKVLASLVNYAGYKDEENVAPLVITSIPALVRKTTLYNEFASACHEVKAGMKFDPLALLGKWEAMGYQTDTLVEIPGTVSRRGGILDIFPPTNEMPARLEFMGNTIESIRLFDPISQRSFSSVETLPVCPATEILTPLNSDEGATRATLGKLGLTGCTAGVCREFEQEIEMLINKQKLRNLQFYAPLFNTDSLLSYLPQDGLLIMDEPSLLRQAADTFQKEAEEMRLQRARQGEVPADYPKPYFIRDEIFPVLESYKSMDFTVFREDRETVETGFAVATNYTGQIPVFIENVKKLLNRKKRIILTSFQAARLEELFDDAEITASPVNEIPNIPPLPSLTVLQGSLAQGWVLDGETYLFTDAEIFGFVKQHRLNRRRPVSHHKLYTDFVRGDYVVHVEHGISKFAGVTMMGTADKQKEYMILQYAAGDRLYVPTDQIDRVSRYLGAGEHPPVLTRLGTQDWSQTKKKVKEGAAAIAKDLLALYAAREGVPGFAFSPDSIWQQEFEASFQYVETPDQIEAVKNVKEDMEKPRPMDRLVCGDVGYGKTEIAVRAAFKCVMDGRQVAMLVPTTILAQQHLNTFRQRMEAFPMKVEMLSRFRTHKEQKTVIKGLSNGSIDICIGTHRLIQKDVVFKNLGLLIIDEEQRFGVAHKEYIKKKKTDVHVLTLSATPIPRTLHMALAGVRDMSTMETPPEDRLPIKTYVAEYDDRLVREAILKEMERNGQVFFVHNRVQTIYQTAARLRVLIPEARISVGHGQMGEHELERVMNEFIEGKADVLVCSTIIESGLDMPSVNTMIVNRADRFGLTQLYQLRGRIGRGTNLAYAYFLYDKERNLTTTAEKRLKTIYEATELGAGFGIAMKDLEIRGAGNLLGMKQSGFISAVGFELYSRLLGETVEELKSKQTGPAKVPPKQPQLPLPSIDLPLPAFIPDNYVGDVDVRLSLYQTLVKADDAAQIEKLATDFKDRFGAPPEEVKNLLYIVTLKVLAAKAGIESISTESGQIVIRRFQGMPFDQRRLQPLVKDGIRLGVTHLFINPDRIRDWKKVLGEIIQRTTINELKSLRLS